MKSNKILSVIIALFLLITSFGSVYYYNKLEDKKYNIDHLKYQIDYDQIIYLYSLIDKLDDNYEMITIDFKDTFYDYQQTEIIDYFKNLINEMNYIGQDENISYLIKKNQNVVASKGDTKFFDDSTSLVYTDISFKNNIVCSGDFCNEYKNFSIHDFFDNFYIQIGSKDGKPAYMRFSKPLYLEDIQINIPEGYQIYFKVNENIIPDGTIHNHLDTFEPFCIYYLVVVAISFICLFILFMLIPTSSLENTRPYKIIKNWLFEINIFIFGSILVALGAGLIYLLKYTIDGTIIYYLNISTSFLNIFNYISWFIFYLVYTILLFLLKYMFKDGFFNYIKNHTLLGIVCIKTKSYINKLANINLKSSLIYQLISILIVNGLIVCIFMNLFKYKTLGTIMFGTIIYTLLLFIPSLLFIDKLYKQYKILLDKTKLLSEGQFDLQIDENLGIFNEYKNELLQVKDGFEKAVQEEIKASSLRTELITNVSHDLKTPITCIKNYVTLLKDESIEEDKKKEYIQSIDSYTNRLTTLVEDLFEVSKVTSGNISLDLIDLDLVDLVKQVLAENDELLLNNQLHVISKFNCDHVQVKLDSNKTYRIFENLIVNISKYALPNSRVYVEMNETQENVIVEFKNISKDEMTFTAESITERFVRGDSSRNTNGSGLGLAIVKSYSELQNIDFKITIDGDLFKTTLTFKKNNQ